jgi:import receptor subunit TOM70
MAPVNAPAPQGPGPFPVAIPASETSSFFDRISNWASENKGVVYTIAGITLVVGAGGAVYYFSNDSSRGEGAADSSANKRKRQRERKKAKERAEKEAAPEKGEAAGMLCALGRGSCC